MEFKVANAIFSGGTFGFKEEIMLSFFEDEPAV